MLTLFVESLPSSARPHIWLIAPELDLSSGENSAAILRHRALCEALRHWSDLTLVTKHPQPDSQVSIIDLEEAFSALHSEHVGISHPEILIGSHHSGSSLAAHLVSSLPSKMRPVVVLDVNGSPLFEGETQSDGKPWYERTYRTWKGQRMLLQWAEVADAFLAASGRLSEYLTDEYRIPSYTFAPYPDASHIPQGQPPLSHPPFLLWIGGLNSWTDPHDVAAAIDVTLSAHPDLEWRITGDILPGIEEHALPTLKKLVDAMPDAVRSRVFFLGFVSSDELSDLLQHCLAGICIDRPCLDTQYGARNRIFDFLQQGKPILMTHGSEITEVLSGHLSTLVPRGQWQTLPSLIARISRDPEIFFDEAVLALEFLSSQRMLRDEALKEFLQSARRLSLSGKLLTPSSSIRILLASVAFLCSFAVRIWRRCKRYFLSS